jgi:homoserine dehydrogenase
MKPTVSLASTQSSVPETQRVHVGMIGLGTVGTGVVKVLQQHPALVLDQVAVRDVTKSRNVSLPASTAVGDDPFVVVRDPNIHLVVEVMGGAEVAYELVREALTRKKHVVTANKELIAKHGPELFALAKDHGVRLLFEAAVAGGIPIIMPLKLSLAGNRILEIAGILNGTTNYILTKMTDEGWTYADALKKAQDQGFAEADPTNDVEGFDTRYKIAILSSIAFKQAVNPGDIYCEGISQITPLDIQTAESLGYTLKLIGLARTPETGTEALDIRVHPMLVPHDHPLAAIKNEYNAVWVRGDAVGDVMFYGRGAGEMPTASAVSADILAIANDMLNGNVPIPAMAMDFQGSAKVLSATETVNQYYIRLNTTDLPGVIGNLGKACGEFGVSLRSVLQRGTATDGTASIILVTHGVQEKQLKQALAKIESQETTREVACLLRVL